VLNKKYFNTSILQYFDTSTLRIRSVQRSAQCNTPIRNQRAFEPHRVHAELNSHFYAQLFLREPIIFKNAFTVYIVTCKRKEIKDSHCPWFTSLYTFQTFSNNNILIVQVYLFSGRKQKKSNIIITVLNYRSFFIEALKGTLKTTCCSNPALWSIFKPNGLKKPRYFVAQKHALM